MRIKRKKERRKNIFGDIIKWNKRLSEIKATFSDSPWHLQIIIFNETFTNFPYFSHKTSYSSYYLSIFHAVLCFSFAAKNLLYLRWKILVHSSASLTTRSRMLKWNEGSRLSDSWLENLWPKAVAARIQVVFQNLISVSPWILFFFNNLASDLSTFHSPSRVIYEALFIKLVLFIWDDATESHG